MKEKIIVDGKEITIRSVNQEEYFSLTDMARGGNSAPDRIINNWLRNRGTLELIALWEKMSNPHFKPIEFDRFYLSQAGKNNFAPSASQMIEQTGIICLRSKRGRGGGTYAQRDLAFAFGAWISPAFQLLLIREFQRLKSEEYRREQLEWNYTRFLSKINYSLQAETIKRHIEPRLSPADQGFAYASEADLLNLAIFGLTAKQWREENPKLAKKGNIRDFASIRELTILSNLEALNAQLIRNGASKEARYKALCESALYQLDVFANDKRIQGMDRDFLAE